MSLRDDWSWSAEALYACPCGALVTAQRWRWIDADARPDVAARVRASGPLSGACPRCRRAVAGGGVWLEVAPGRQAATLVLSADRRGDLIAALQGHLADVQVRAERAAGWLIQPAVAFAPAGAEEEARPALSAWPAGQVEHRPGIVLGPRAAEVAGARVEVRAKEGGEGRVPEEPPDLEAVAPGDGARSGQVARDRAQGAGTGGQGAADRADSSGSFRQVAADRADSSGTFRQVAERADGSGSFRQVEARGHEPARREGSGPTPSATVEPQQRREGSGPTPSAVVEPRRREGSGPVVAAPASDGRARQGRPLGPSGAAREEAPRREGERALDDTFPGRKARRPDGKGEDGAEPSGLRRAAGGRAAQEAGDVSPRRGEHHEADHDGQDHEDMARRAGRAGQEHEDMSRRAGEAEEAGEGERSSLRAAVARALSPGPGAPGRREEGAARPAAVLPAPRGVTTRADAEPREEAADGEQSGSTWSKRQVSEGEVPRPRARAGSGGEQPPPAPPARLTAETQRQSLASLGREGGAVQVTATLNDATARVWASAPVRARPIHLRGLGYPLVGVRCVAEAGGESLVIDAVVDIGEPATTDIFKHLAREFRVRLQIRSEGGLANRELVAPEYQRNAAACLESAQQQLGAGEFPPDAYRTAREVLAARTAGQRLEPVRNALSEDLLEGCRRSAGAAWAALERLDQASRKDNLSRMTEVDGLPVETYEAIRSAVLAAAVEFGLPAPARFWRRWLASEQARDIGVFVQRLVAARAASVARGEDLTPEAAEAAWRGLYDLCQHKDLTPPPDLAKALGLGRTGAARRSSQAPVVVSGEIRDASASAEPRGKAPRLKDVMSRLVGSPSDGDIRAVIAALPELTEDDVAGLLPALAELGARVAPELGPLLRAPQRWVRQAAAILLGHIGDRKAEAPLLQMLGEEPTAAWVDAARALGNFGPRVVGPLCSLLRGAPTGRRDVLVPRVARSLAELVRAEGSAPDSPGRQAVENLLDVGDVAVSTAARRALATLGAVRDEVAGDDAEAARRFSLLASDAITAPEVDAFADDEIDELDVEVGDD